MRPFSHFLPRQLCRRRCRRHNSTHAVSLQRHGPPISAGTIDQVKQVITHDLPTAQCASAQPEGSMKGSRTEKMKETITDSAVQSHPSLKSRRGSNKTEKYLESLRVAGSHPTLDDLLRLKPTRTIPPCSSGYAGAYMELVDRLCNTFSKSQLIEFGEQLNLGSKWVRAGRRKMEYAQSIVERSWGWENMREVEKRKRDSKEVISKSFAMSASELFLLLGRDGSALHRLSMDYKVNISVHTEPLTLRIRGSRGSLEELGTLIAKLGQSIVSEPLDIPSKTHFSPSLLQQISRVANAYVENVGPAGKLLVYATDKGRLELAKRLVTRAAYNLRQHSHVPLFSLADDSASAADGSAYALFPFHPHRQLPWVVVPGNTFRSRRVGNWLGDIPSQCSALPLSFEKSNGLLTDINGDCASLKDLISSCSTDFSTSVITASPGHILITEQMQGGRSRILPPFQGHTIYSDYLNWLRNTNTQRVFLPSLPSPLYEAQPSREKIIHRLTYYAVSDKVGTVLPNVPLSTKSIVVEALVLEQESNGLRGEYLSESKTQPEMRPNENKFLSSMAMSETPVNELTHTTTHSSWEPLCRYGWSMELLVALPNRPMDVKFSVFNSASAPQIEQFAELGSYFTELREYLDKRVSKNPEAPLFIRDGQDTYVLHSSASVRQSLESINVQSHLDLDLDIPSIQSISTITENITDLDTAYKTVKCEISCNAISSHEAWLSFLRDLDVLTSLGYKPATSFGKTTLSNNSEIPI